MINSVRQSVLAIANKHQQGYITPADFNLYAKQAQLDIFEDYFYRYNQWIVRQNQRASGSGYADILKNLEEVIDNFSEEKDLDNVGNTYTLPSDYYLINKLLVKTKLLASGTTTSTTAVTLIQAGATFVSDGVVVGDQVCVIDDSVLYVANITVISEDTIRTDSTHVWNNNSSNLVFAIYKSNTFKESERLSHTKATMLNASNITAPNITFPAYTQSGSKVNVFPVSLTNVGQIKAQYIRKPKDPNWTYQIVGGNPLYNISDSNHQDLEIPLTDEPLIISKILKYVGISIREADVYKSAQESEIQEKQKQG